MALTTDQQRLLFRANQLIAMRTSYGRRVEPPVYPSWLIIWFNSSASWDRAVGYGKIKRADGMRPIDANQFYLAGTARDIDAILPLMDPLPLYRNSTEARTRGGNPALNGLSTALKLGASKSTLMGMSPGDSIVKGDCVVRKSDHPWVNIYCMKVMWVSNFGTEILAYDMKLNTGVRMFAKDVVKVEGW